MITKSPYQDFVVFVKVGGLSVDLSVEIVGSEVIGRG